MSNNLNTSSSIELFTFENDSRSVSSKTFKRHIYDFNSVSEETSIKRKKANKPKHPTSQVSKELNNSHPLLRKMSFSEFDDYELIIEDDRSPRRLDWVYIEEHIERSTEYFKQMKINWNFAENMERERLNDAAGHESMDK